MFGPKDVVMSITKEAVIKLLGDRPVAYHPILARVLRGVNEAVFVSQLLYWYGKGKKADCRAVSGTAAEIFTLCPAGGTRSPPIPYPE